MSDDILDEKTHYARFKKPVNLIVNKTAWEMICDELQRKAAIGTFIFLGISILVVFITMALGAGTGGIFLFVASIGLTIFLNINVRKRFTELRTLSNHSYIISGSQIIDDFQGKKQTIPFSKIKDIEFHNWGVELDTKKNRKMSDKNAKEGIIKIPRAVNDYERVVATFEHLKKG